jgi:hypothetical protein
MEGITILFPSGILEVDILVPIDTALFGSNSFTDPRKEYIAE